MGFFRKENALKGVNYLELTPLKNIEHETGDDGLVKILIPKFKNSFFLNLIPRHKSKHIRIKLDEIGSSVWLSIDGKKNVEAIIDELNLKFGDNVQPAIERVTKFLSELFKNNFIVFNEIKTKKATNIPED